jgi:hypothetical protein
MYIALTKNQNANDAYARITSRFMVIFLTSLTASFGSWVRRIHFLVLSISETRGDLPYWNLRRE